MALMGVFYSENIERKVEFQGRVDWRELIYKSDISTEVDVHFIKWDIVVL